MEMYTPYKIQEDAIETTISYINNGGNRGILVAPCSFGKSIVIAELCRRFANFNIVVVHPTVELLVQNKEKYALSSKDYDVWSASLGEKFFNRVTFGTVGSFDDKLVERLERDGKKIIIIVDGSGIMLQKMQVN